MDFTSLGLALTYWLNYQSKMQRSYLINEDALKYPISEFLSNAENKWHSDIRLEVPHPELKTRRLDLVIERDGKMQTVFEHKMAKLTTPTLNEKRRIFSDLVRLKLISAQEISERVFIVAGTTIDFRSYFMDGSNPDSFYRKWFGFIKNQEKELEFDQDSLFYNRFESDYKYDLPDCLKITTKLQFITPYEANVTPYTVGIWTIS